jgi:ferredoxin-nitrite reductase
MEMTSEANLSDPGFSREQKEYLQGFFAGLACAGRIPFVGHLPDGRITHEPIPGLVNGAVEPESAAEETVHGTPVSELCEQERWKVEQHGLDTWDKLLEHANANKFPDKADTFRFRYHGLFYVAPAQNSFMLRCRIPAGELTSMQLRGLADIAQDWGDGYADITTRANFQIREITPRNMVKCILKLQEIGLTSRGSGVDNVRNITANPTAGIDKDELIDTRPFAKGLHYYILNNRDMYDMPRKFNVAFDGGGAITTVADTNDIGFVAVRVSDGKSVEPGIYFRIELAGVTGHQQFAKDAGIIITPDQCVAVAAAIIRVFAERGDRTNRKRARLKYVIDRWGIPKFIEHVEQKLAFPLIQFPLDQCEPRKAPIPHGHIGVYQQVQPGLNYIGAVITVGRMKPKQMRRIADIAQNYGSGDIRLTVWQNLIIPNIPDQFVETVKKNLVKMGFHYSATTVSGGLIACTGNTGCQWSSTNTKGQAVLLARHLEKKIRLDLPINIHLTGCPNSCAQHYMGDIGLLGTKVSFNGEKVEAYNVVLGGGFGEKQAVARDIFKGIPFSQIPTLIEYILSRYLALRKQGESFVEFTRRHSVKELQEMFSE